MLNLIVNVFPARARMNRPPPRRWPMPRPASAPGDKTLAKEFERLKRAAKGAFEAKRLETEQLRRALGAQGVSVANLAAEWHRRQAAQTKSHWVVQEMSQPISATIPASAKGRIAPSKSESKIDQEGLSRIEGSVDRLPARIGLMGQVTATRFAAQQLCAPHARG